LSKDDYGEGGFSKGFYISIPFDLMTIGPNRNRAVVSWTPLTRDGIQLTEEQKWIHTLPDISSLQIHSGVLLYGR
ncbi:YjbH domain-containing protein, partial [Escherichia coli]|uniref:YjbH domain-containing protein n=1 Tax=Escherichia coli TaxID=562 RepID=UPI00201AA924